MRQIKCDCDRQERIVKELINKVLLQLLIVLFKSSLLSYKKRNDISRKKKPQYVYIFFSDELK